MHDSQAAKEAIFGPDFKPLAEVAWQTATAPVAYPEAVATMEAWVEAIRTGTASELLWLVEHPPLYTAGTSANPGDLVDPYRFPVYPTGREIGRAHV